ncbi:hypothetical protein SD436_04580 [Streptococcus sp. 2A/TPW/M5]
MLLSNIFFSILVESYFNAIPAVPNPGIELLTDIETGLKNFSANESLYSSVISFSPKSLYSTVPFPSISLSNSSCNILSNAKDFDKESSKGRIEKVTFELCELE